VSSSAAIPPAKKRGQPAIEVRPITSVDEVSPNVPSSILAKRKRDDIVGV